MSDFSSDPGSDSGYSSDHGSSPTDSGPISDNTYSTPRADIHPPSGAGGNHTWSRILAILNIMYGIFGLYCVFGIPLFIGSVKLFAAADAAERFKRTGDPADARRALAEYHSASQLTAWNWLLFLGLLIAAMIIAFAIIGFGGIMEAINSSKT